MPADTKMTRRRYPILRVTIVALFAHCLAHAWRTGHGGIQLRLDTQNGSIRASVLKIPRGGGELPPSDGDEIDESSSAEHDTETAEKGEEIDRLEREENKEMENASDKTTTLQTSSPPPTTSSPQRKVRHTSDVIVNLIGKNNVLKQESIDLRQLITSRAQSYIDDLSLASTNDEKLPKPKRVLHFVAPKIPAIKNSPDVMLRVQSFKGGTDTGVAACAIGTVARLCELYDRQKLQDIADEEEFVSIGEEIVRDRRFQQLVELVLCGVDIKKRKKEAEKMNGSNVAEKSVEARDIEDVLDEEDAVIDDGLSVQDACRAAWGIALLAGFHTESFSDVATEDILTALSLRSRELLLARLQLLREGETMKECNDGHLSLVERLNQDAEELAEDAASAMWAFACVKACTGVRSVALFETCCTILCQSPDDLRERAAKEKDGLDGSSFEVNDVVDKLQRAESDEIVDESIDSGNSTSAHETNENDGDESDSMDELSSKDALLDWLTPNEVTDVLWALALQGSTVDTDLKEEIALSETASAFREIAFDRLVMWLRRDLGIIEDVKKDSGSNSSSISADGIEEEIIELENPTVSLETTGTGEGETIIEVVDAASLLASTATMETEVVNANAVDRVEDSREGVGEGQIQVVDAATLLACSPEGQMDADTELLVASTLARSYEPLEEEIEEKPEDRSTTTTESIACYDRQIVSERLDIKSDMTTLLLSRRLSFSPHDLCSIAWAVTDLRDPLRYLIVDLITQMFASLGKESFEVLSMADLSNLAWAVARSTSEKRSLTFAEYSETPAANVTRWTAETALSRLGIYGQRLGDHDVSMMVRSMLQEFQPPELGRLLWSLTCTVANYIDPLVHKKQRDVALSQLATTALLTAGTNLSIFSTEDLTRIAWAFLELCDVSTALSQPLVGEALGSILATIESSLLLWESAPHSKSAQDTKRSEDTLHFSTFFGKSRLPWRLLNQMIHEHEDDEESQKSSRKTSLPLLRDLPVDPSSLCKLSSAYSRLAQEQRDVMGGWTFVRVAVRLLSSKNGQLMEQCPLIDVIGLCHACAISEVNGRERGQVLRLFAGRVVQFMNDALDPDAATHGRAAARLERATPWEIAALVWSIGELGARHFPADENRQQAHRKLRLISDRPLLTEDELNTLSVASTANLVRFPARVTVILVV